MFCYPSRTAGSVLEFHQISDLALRHPIDHASLSEKKRPPSTFHAQRGETPLPTPSSSFGVCCRCLALNALYIVKSFNDSKSNSCNSRIAIHLGVVVHNMPRSWRNIASLIRWILRRKICVFIQWVGDAGWGLRTWWRGWWC